MPKMTKRWRSWARPSAEDPDSEELISILRTELLRAAEVVEEAEEALAAVKVDCMDLDSECHISLEAGKKVFAAIARLNEEVG